AEEFNFLETLAANPGEADRDQINLNVNAEKIFKNKRDRIDASGNLQDALRGKQSAPQRQRPVNNRFEQRRHRAEQQDQIENVTAKAKSLMQRANERAVQTPPVDQHQHSRDCR